MATSIALIIVLGLGAEYLFRRPELPGLVGMLIVGVILGPSILDLMNPDIMHVSSDLRGIALVVILLRAGFELHRDILKHVGRAAALMSCIPALFEIGAVVGLGPRLFDMTYAEAAMLGAILGAVSPAVVVPLMIGFMDRGRGTRKGIPTLLLGASSVDDVFVIVPFTIFLDMYGGGDVNVLVRLAEIPESIVLGILVGVIPGYLLHRLFRKYDWRAPKRTLVVLGVAILLTWIESESEEWVPIAGLLGVMAVGFIILEKSEPIGIMIIGERVLDHGGGGRSPYRFRQLRESLGLPQVGQRVRNKSADTVWKVIKEKEEWIEPGRGEGSSPAPIPAITTRYWHEAESPGPRRGRTKTERYTPGGRSFADHWEILYDW